MTTKQKTLKNLHRSLGRLDYLTEGEIDRLYQAGSTKTLNRAECFIRAGQVPKTFAFVSSGLFRYLYEDEKGRQYTKAFMPEFSFLSSYSAMIGNTPSYFFIEALEDSVIIEFDYSAWLKLRELNPRWDRFLITLLEKGYTKKEARERELLLLDAETRYRLFLDEYPTLESRVKQHMIASYLGITPESLSRIRKK